MSTRCVPVPQPNRHNGVALRFLKTPIRLTFPKIDLRGFCDTTGKAMLHRCWSFGALKSSIFSTQSLLHATRWIRSYNRASAGCGTVCLKVKCFDRNSVAGCIWVTRYVPSGVPGRSSSNSFTLSVKFWEVPVQCSAVQCSVCAVTWHAFQTCLGCDLDHISCTSRSHWPGLKLL